MSQFLPTSFLVSSVYQSSLSGPTGGFLVGFLLAALVIGFLADHWHWNSWWRDLALAEGSLVLIYTPGVLWLCHVLLLQGNTTIAALISLAPILAVVAVLARPLRVALTEEHD